MSEGINQSLEAFKRWIEVNNHNMMAYRSATIVVR